MSSINELWFLKSGEIPSNLWDKNRNGELSTILICIVVHHNSQQAPASKPYWEKGFKRFQNNIGELEQAAKSLREEL